MVENRFKARQAKRAADEDKILEQANGENTDDSVKVTTSQSLKANGDGTTPIQFYITKDMKKRLKTYCASNDKKMTGVLIGVLDEFLKSNGF